MVTDLYINIAMIAKDRAGQHLHNVQRPLLIAPHRIAPHLTGRHHAIRLFAQAQAIPSVSFTDAACAQGAGSCPADMCLRVAAKQCMLIHEQCTTDRGNIGSHESL